jgi:hypothetical protein
MLKLNGFRQQRLKETELPVTSSNDVHVQKKSATYLASRPRKSIMDIRARLRSAS